MQSNKIVSAAVGWCLNIYKTTRSVYEHIPTILVFLNRHNASILLSRSISFIVEKSENVLSGRSYLFKEVNKPKLPAGVIFNEFCLEEGYLDCVDMFYFASKKNELYQLIMWLEVFIRLNKQFFICVRNKQAYNELTQLGYKAILIVRMRDISFIATQKGVRRVYYCNNAANNTHMVRYNQLVHILLLHGDSDKPPSFNPVSQMYDLLLVAGEAAIRRYYKHGIYIPRSKFVIASRPQLAVFDEIELRLTSPVGSNKTILVCTTWRGYQSSSNYSCLDMIPELAKQVLKAGDNLIIRPHPQTFSDFNDMQILRELRDILDDFNYSNSQFGVMSSVEDNSEFKSIEHAMTVSDVLVCDLSSVAHDWTYSNKPLIILKSPYLNQEIYTTSSLFETGPVTVYTGNENFYKLIVEEDSRLAVHGLMRRKYLLGLDESESALDKFKSALGMVEGSYDKSDAFKSMLVSDGH